MQNWCKTSWGERRTYGLSMDKPVLCGYSESATAIFITWSEHDEINLSYIRPLIVYFLKPVQSGDDYIAL